MYYTLVVHRVWPPVHLKILRGATEAYLDTKQATCQVNIEDYIQMSVKVVQFKELQQLQTQIPVDYNLIAFKMVKVGPGTLSACNYEGSKICEITEKQQEFFLIGNSEEELKQAMHDLVDRFLSA